MFILPILHSIGYFSNSYIDAEEHVYNFLSGSAFFIFVVYSFHKSLNLKHFFKYYSIKIILFYIFNKISSFFYGTKSEKSTPQPPFIIVIISFLLFVFVIQQSLVYINKWDKRSKLFFRFFYLPIAGSIFVFWLLKNYYDFDTLTSFQATISPRITLLFVILAFLFICIFPHSPKPNRIKVKKFNEIKQQIDKYWDDKLKNNNNDNESDNDNDNDDDDDDDGDNNDNVVLKDNKNNIDKQKKTKKQLIIDEIEKSIDFYDFLRSLSAAIILLFLIVSSLLILLTGQYSVIVFLCLFSQSLILLNFSRNEKNKKNPFHNLLHSDYLITIIWALLIGNYYYATNHHNSMTSINDQAGFIIISDFNIYWCFFASIVEAFSSQILFIILIPLIYIFSFKQPNLNNNKNSNNNNNFPIRKIIDQISPSFYIILLIELINTTCMSMAATIHRRHLMVWAIFAPRFLFSAISLFIIQIMILLVMLFINRVINKTLKSHLILSGKFN